jgi:PAS domain S-box-containing protein
MDRRPDPYRAMIDSIPMLAWCCAPDGAAEFVNQRWLDYTGLSMDEALGWGWKVSIHPDDAATLLDTWGRLLRSGQPGEAEARMRRVDGVYRWFQFRASPARNEQGKIERWYGTHADIEDLKRTQGKLRRSEAYLAEAQRLSHTGSLGWKVSTGELYWSEETHRIYQVDQKIKPTIELVMSMIHPDDLARVQKTCQCAAADGKDYTHKYRIVLPDGSLKSLHIEAHSTRDSAGNIEYVGAVMDVTTHKRAEMLLALENRVLEMIATGEPLGVILDTLCQRVDEICLDSQCTIMLLDPDGKHLRRGAGPSFPDTYLNAIDGIEIGPSVGSCGTASYRKEQVIVSDVTTDPLWAGYREFARGYGVRACWSTPILNSAGDVLGTFGISWRVPRSPTEIHQHIISQVTHLAAVAIERKQSEDAIRAAKFKFERILEIAEDAIISVSSSQHIVLFNQGAERIFGYSHSEVMGKPLDLLLPRHFASAHTRRVEDFANSNNVARAMGQRSEVFGVRKDGKEFPAEASISKLDLGGELVFTVILRDITERKRAAEELRASELVARGQIHALTRTLDALAMESAPDRHVEHVLRTISVQFGAHGTSVWRRLPTGSICFEAAIESGKLITKSTPEIAALSLPLPIEDIWPYPEQLRAATPSVMEDIREAPDSQWRERLQRQGVVTILLAPMMIAGQVEGAIGIRFTQKRTFRNDEIELARALAHQALLATQLTRLSMRSRQTAVLAERNRLARDMHDVLAQGFTGVIVQLEAAEDANLRGMPKAAAEHLTRAAEMARYGLREARRSVHALRPLALYETHVCAAMQELLRNKTAGTELLATFKLHGTPRQLPAIWEDHLLRIEQEALTNAFRHARADHFTVALFFDPASIRLELRDDGGGFDATTQHEGLGLLGIKERVEEMGGTLTIASAQGEGTEISVHVPLPSNGDSQGDFDE